MRKLPGVTDELMASFGEKEIKTLDDLADLSRDEFVDKIPASGLKNAEIDEIIMAARSHWFDEEPSTAEKEKNSDGEEKTDK